MLHTSSCTAGCSCEWCVMPLLRAAPPQLQEDAQQQAQLSPATVLPACARRFHHDSHQCPVIFQATLPVRGPPALLQDSGLLCEESCKGLNAGYL